MNEALCEDMAPGEVGVFPEPLDPHALEQQAVFTETMLSHYDRVLRFIIRQFPDFKERAQDLTQDTFLRAWRCYGSFRHESEASTWLVQIATNLCIDESRKINRRSEPVSNGGMFELTVNHDADIVVEAVEIRQIMDSVKKAIGSLRPVYKDAYGIRIFQGKSCLEIAEQQGAASATTKWRINRAKQEVTGGVLNNLGATNYETLRY